MKTNYQSPVIEIIEIEIEDAVLNSSDETNAVETEYIFSGKGF